MGLELVCLNQSLIGKSLRPRLSLIGKSLQPCFCEFQEGKNHWNISLFIPGTKNFAIHAEFWSVHCVGGGAGRTVFAGDDMAQGMVPIEHKSQSKPKLLRQNFSPGVCPWFWHIQNRCLFFRQLVLRVSSLVRFYKSRFCFFLKNVN